MPRERKREERHHPNLKVAVILFGCLFLTTMTTMWRVSTLRQWRFSGIFRSPLRPLSTSAVPSSVENCRRVIAKGTRQDLLTYNDVLWRKNHRLTDSPLLLSHVRSFSSTAASSTDDHGSVIPFLLADIGEGIAEVELLQWFVQEGDEVRQFDRICEVQSDKATVEITSRYDGRITSLEHNKGDMVNVGSPLVYIETDGQNSAAAASSHKNLHTASTQAEPMEEDEKLNIPSIASQYHLSTDATTINHGNDDVEYVLSHGSGSQDVSSARLTGPASSKVLTTPAIRKLATEYSLDLSTIMGTGPKRRVLKGDVLTVLRERGLMTNCGSSTQNKEQPKPTSATAAAAASTGRRIDPDPNRSISAITSADQLVLPLEADTVMEIRGYNRLMVQSMTASLQIPHMVYADEINVTGLRTHYKSNLPFLPYCIKAASMALSKYPVLNASYDADANRVLLWANHNIGIAMDTPRGLIVPVIKQVQNKSLAEISSELGRLKDCAKISSVPVEDLQGATFTLSNIGAIGGGGTYMSPIVTSPQVAIGALGQVQRVPRFVSENSKEVYEAHIVNISWGGDHRVVDGATMARFHTQWKEYLQNPISLIQEMK